MRPLILLAFIAIPVAEIALFIQVGGLIGVLWTLGLIVLTAMLGVALLRRQGLQTLQMAQAEMDQGRMPMRQVFDGACLLVAGAFLLTPGFFTDALGFSLLLPQVRGTVLAAMGSMVTGSSTIIFGGLHNHRSSAPPRQSYDLDGEYQEVDPQTPQDR